MCKITEDLRTKNFCYKFYAKRLADDIVAVIEGKRREELVVLREVEGQRKGPILAVWTRPNKSGFSESGSEASQLSLHHNYPFQVMSLPLLMRLKAPGCSESLGVHCFVCT